MSRAVRTSSDRVLATVLAKGGTVDRAQLMGELAPALGIRGCRSAVGLALLRGIIRLDEQDTVHAVEDVA